MSLSVEKLDKNMAKLTIEAPAQVFEAAVQAAYQREKNTISIPGFRKGKVPRVIIERYYGKTVFHQTAINDLIPELYAKELKDCEEDIVSYPDITVTQAESGQPFIFTALVATKPEATVTDYMGVSVPQSVIEISDEAVDAHIEKERQKNARSVTVEDRAVQEGDEVVLDFEGYVDGIPFEGGKGEGYELVIGSNSFIPGFEDALIGAQVGITQDVNVTFPQDYQAPELAGKESVFVCTVQEIRENCLPELTDEFASEVSEFETMDEYRADVKRLLTEEQSEKAKAQREQAVIKAIVEKASMEIPEAMIETRAEQMFEDTSRRMRASGLNMETYMQILNQTREQILEQMTERAKETIQNKLVLEAIAKAEGITTTDEELEEELAVGAKEQNTTVEELKERLTDEDLKQIKNDLCVKKALELVTNAAIEE
ncbi:MAG: trigger factor [Clostridium sp.]|jgi:trigger factor|nr:trigger factor [Clostridium sp.]